MDFVCEGGGVCSQICVPVFCDLANPFIARLRERETTKLRVIFRTIGIFRVLLRTLKRIFDVFGELITGDRLVLGVLAITLRDFAKILRPIT